MYVPMSVLCELWMTPFLKNIFNVNNHTAAYGGTMICIGMAVGGMIYPKFINTKRPTDRVILYGSLLSTTLFLTVPFFSYITLMYAFGLLFLSGVAMGAQVLCFNWAKEKTPTYFNGTAMALTNAIVMIGGIIFQPLMGHILDLTWIGGINAEGVRIYDAQSYQYAMISVPVCFLISSAIIFFGKQKKI
jgi:MFS family permease